MTMPGDQQPTVIVTPNPTPETGAPVTGTPSGTVSIDLVQQAIEQALARQAEIHKAEMDDMRSSIETGVNARWQPPIAVIPAHSGGPGTEIAPTWSFAEQLESMAAEATKARETSAQAVNKPREQANNDRVYQYPGENATSAPVA
jgi:hypothetical protein